MASADSPIRTSYVPEMGYIRGMAAIIYWLGFFWCLPNTALGMALAIPYGARDFTFSDGAIVATAKRAIGKPGAQTWGVLIYGVGEHNRARLDSRGPLWRHEAGGHIAQALRWGPLFMLLYGAEWLFRFAFAPGPPVKWYGDRGNARWFRAYYRLSWEKDARSLE